MKKHLSCMACIGAIFFVPTMAFAGAGWTDYVPVTELTPTINGRFLVQLKLSENPSGCKNKETFYRGYGIPGSEQMFQTLLQAVASGKKVRVYVTGACELNGYSEISSVGIVP